MATSPITKGDFEALSSSSDACEAFKALLRIPGNLNLFLGWLLDDSGSISEDAAASAADYLTPIGAILMWSGTSVPSDNWRVCNGQAVSRTTYDTLFSRCGTTWGSGDGSTTFNLPNFQDRIPVGAGTTAGFGQRAGASTVTLTEPNIPSHSHSITLRAINVTGEDGSIAGGVYANTTPTVSQFTETTASSGSGSAFSITPPVTGVYFIIKIK